MKEQAIQYVALHIHQQPLVFSVRDEQGSVVMRATVATEAKTIVALVRGLRGRVHIAFEEGTQAQWLHDVLRPHVERVIVCNTRGRGEISNKNDRVDADRLSELLRLGALKPVYHGATALLTLKELVRSYVALVEDGTRVMLRIKARPSAWDQNCRSVGLSAVPAERVAGAARGAWCPNEGRSAVHRARCTAGTATDGEGGDDRRSAPAVRLEDPAIDSVPRASPRSGDPGDHGYTVAVPNEEAWPYVRSGVVTRSSADQEFAGGKLPRRKREPLTRGLNRDHHPLLESVFKGAANAAGRRKDHSKKLNVQAT
jgi:hypothetical protein